MSAIEWPETPRGKLTISGAEPPLPPMIADFQKTLHEFALKVMRPVGAKLDRMSAEEVIAPGSPVLGFPQAISRSRHRHGDARLIVCRKTSA